MAVYQEGDISPLEEHAVDTVDGLVAADVGGTVRKRLLRQGNRYASDTVG